MVGEACEDTGGLVKKGQRDAVGLHPLQLGRGVFGGLVLDAGNGVPEGFLFGLDHADRFGIDEEHVVRRAGVGQVFADGLAFALREVDRVLVLHGPARGAELRVDGVASDLFRGLVRHASPHDIRLQNRGGDAKGGHKKARVGEARAFLRSLLEAG